MRAPTGLSRRQVLVAAVGTAVAAAVAACTGKSTSRSTPTPAESPSPSAAVTASGATGLVPIPSCVVKPALIEGPNFVDEKLNRSDIRGEPDGSGARPGMPLVLKMSVASVAGAACAALPGAQVDVWHCDAGGDYSDVAGGGSGKKFLRGYQLTDGNGALQFTTIYPGWYTTRAIHIHFKIRTFAAGSKTSEFTSQLFFDDAISDEVMGQSPYNTRGTRDTRNARDSIYGNTGTSLLLTPVKGSDGYTADFSIGLSHP